MAALWLDIITAGSSVATAVGVFIAARQLRATREQAVTQFEDGLSAQYRELSRRLPVAALLGEALTDAEHVAALSTFYHYFDLSNEQAYLAERGRVRPSTWAEWCDGIRQNLARPAFARAWAEVGGRAPDSFGELRRVAPPDPLPPVPRAAAPRSAA